MITFLNKSHGLYDIAAYGRLVRVRASGSWNDPTAIRFNEEYKKTVIGLPDGQWAGYFDLRNWGLAIPEALPFLNDLGAWIAPQGQGDHVFLFNGMMIQEQIISNILSVTNHKTHFFSTGDEVRDWLNDTDLFEGDVEELLQTLE